MTFEDATFETAPPKGAAPRKPRAAARQAAPEPVVQPGPPKRRRSPNKSVDNSDIKQMVQLLKGLPGARRKVVLDMLITVFG